METESESACPGTEPCEKPQDGERVQGVDDDWSDDEQQERSMQLGFLEPLQSESVPFLFSDPDWRNWDGGKVGGKPLWLDPLRLPNPADMLCPLCSEPMAFLLEIYSPLDHPAEAFHRAIYVFCCKKRTCVEAGAVKCLRCQLPRNNDFYTQDPKSSIEAPQPELKPPSTCEVCGCKALHSCSQCKRANYCHRSHQKLHWKTHKAVCTGATAQPTPALPSSSSSLGCFAEYEILVEPEELDDSDLPAPKATLWEDAYTAGGKDEQEDAALTQKDYNKALSEQQYDKTYIAFLTHMERSGRQQVLRYSSDSIHHQPPEERGNDPLTTSQRDRGRLFVTDASKEQQQSLVVPACPRCGHARAFECQIMPQLLYYLRVDKDTSLEADPPATPDPDDPAAATSSDPSGQKAKGKSVNKKNTDLNWGTLDVYTCVASCASDGYVEEFIAQQALPLTA